MAGPQPLEPTYEPIVIGHKQISGGNYQVTWSVAPGKVVRRTIPVEAYNEGTIAILTRQLKGKA